MNDFFFSFSHKISISGMYLSYLAEFDILEHLAVYDMQPFLRGRIAPMPAIIQNRIKILLNIWGNPAFSFFSSPRGMVFEVQRYTLK